MDNKSFYELWLEGYSRNPRRKFKSINSYINYIGLIEKDLDMDKDEIYKLKNIKQLEKLESKLRENPKFKRRKIHNRYNLLSALHYYENLIRVLGEKKRNSVTVSM